MKVFYAHLDVWSVKHVPQPLQHLAISNKAAKAGGGVTFYGIEDYDSSAIQGVLRAKVEERPVIDGVVCFSARQFMYGGNLDMQLLRMILDAGYEVHFAREDCSISNPQDLDRIFPMLYSTQQLWERDEPRDSWQPVWDWLDRTPDPLRSSRPGGTS